MGETPSWTSWGADQPELPRSGRRLLTDRLGALTPQRPASVDTARLPGSRLPQPVRDELVALVGAAGVRDDSESRARHAGGQSYADLVRRRSGDASDAPDAVVLP